MMDFEGNDPNTIAMADAKEIEELQAGTVYKTEVDPDDDRFVIVTFRRPKAPNEEMREHTGAQVSLGKFLKTALAYAQGFGLARLVQRGERRVMMVNFDGVLMYAGEIEDPDAPKIVTH